MSVKIRSEEGLFTTLEVDGDVNLPAWAVVDGTVAALVGQASSWDFWDEPMFIRPETAEALKDLGVLLAVTNDDDEQVVVACGPYAAVIYIAGDG